MLNMGNKFLVLAIPLLFGATSGTLSKIEPSLRQIFQTDPSSKVNIFLEMREGNGKVLERLDTLEFSSRTEKVNTMKTQLESLTSSSQKGVLSILKEVKADFVSFWINNRVYVRNATLDLVERLMEDPEVSLVREEEIYHLPEMLPSNKTLQNLWNIDKIEASQAWGMEGGTRGEGVVVAIIDSGARYTHKALRANFREEYGWFDPYTGSTTPSDGVGHGTHITGTIVGSGGIGVAPGAQWIVCRGCGTGGFCQEFALNSCGQWIVCPTRPNGEVADCSKLPHIASNSWGGGKGSYLEIVKAWHNAKIIPVFAIGNDGPKCESAMSPGNLEEVIGVGSTDEDDAISNFSSRGPTASGNLKPDLVAPGRNIKSAWYTDDDAYMLESGTSMACPHVSGVVALLLSRNLSLSFGEIKNLLQNNTERNLGDADVCGSTPPTQYPNNIYGYGRINARMSLEALAEGRYSSAPNTFAKINIFEAFVFIIVYLIFHSVKVNYPM